MLNHIKRAFLAFILLSSVSVFAQHKVFLKWKIKTNEIVSYKTTMEEIDTSKFKDFSINSKGFFGILDHLGNDSYLNEEIKAKKFMADLNKYLNMDMMTYLTRNKRGFIDITVSYKQKDTGIYFRDTSDDRMKDISKTVEMMTKGIQLRGAITDSGAVQSFYVKNDQKNLIAMLFQLPGKQVKIGESWPLDIHFISMDQNFRCDSSYHKNMVTLVGIKKINGEEIAVLKYDIEEYVSGDFLSPFEGKDIPSMMKFTYTGLAEFSVDKGRWLLYDGLMALDASGVLNSSQKKKVTLLPN